MACTPPNCLPIGPDTGIPFSPFKSFPTVASLVSVVTSNLLVFAGLIAFIFIIVGGFGIIMAGNSGDPKKLEDGKKKITMAIVGLLVVIFSFWIVQLIGLIIGMNPLESNTLIK